MKNTTEKAKLIYETSTTVSLNIPPIFFSLYFLYINTKMIYNVDYFMYFLCTAISWGAWYLFYYQKKLLLTEHKVYITKGKKKVHALSLAKDIDTISYSQKGLGVRLGYGTLTIITKEGDEINYLFISKPRVTYEKIVYSMETKILKHNPNFQRTVTKDHMADSINDDDFEE